MKKEEKAVLDLLLKTFQKYIAFLSAFALYTSLESVYTSFIEEKVWNLSGQGQVLSA